METLMPTLGRGTTGKGAKAWFPAMFLAAGLGCAAARAESPCAPPQTGNAPDSSLPCLPLSPIPDAEQKVFFASGSADLSGDAKAVLDRQAIVLLRTSGVSVETVGFADSVEVSGSVEKEALGLKRASAVRDYLIGKGMPGDRIVASGRDYTPIIPRQADERTLAAMRFVRTQARFP